MGFFNWHESNLITLYAFKILTHSVNIISDNWKWVMDWHEMIPSHSLANLLNKHFFPEWLKVLRLWLSNNPNFDEIREWISGWEMIIPDRLKSESLIKGMHFFVLESIFV